MSERTAVYRFYDKDDVLLYVGVTGDFEVRKSKHALTAKWWPEVARHELEWHSSRLDAFIAEATLIRDERPVHNLHSPSPENIAALAGHAKGGRPSTGQMPIQHTRVAQDDWDDLKSVVGSRRRGQVVRDLIAWYLRRPGAPLPDRPSREQMAEIARARLLDSA